MYAERLAVSAPSIPLGAAQTELDDGIALGGEANARGFGGDERLKIKEIEQGGFDELAFQDGATNPDQWFLWKNDRAFGDRVHVQLEFQCMQVFQESGVEEAFAIIACEGFKVIEVGLLEAEAAKILDGIGEAAADGKAAMERCVAEEQMEDGLLIGFVRFPIGAGHGQLVKVGDRQL